MFFVRAAVFFLMCSSAHVHAAASDVWWPKINSGWVPEMKSLESQLDPSKNYISLLIKLPVYAMDLRSAEMFRRSMLPVVNLQHLSKHEMTISHMMIAWRCHTASGQVVQGATGQTGELSNQSRKLFLQGWGLSTLYAVYQDGMTHTPEYLQQKLRESMTAGFPFGHLTFEVEPERCEQMLSFLREFIDHPKEPMKKFGLNLRPERFEGGGCGSFASAMLSKADLLPSLHSGLWRELRGPRRLMGSRRGLPAGANISLPEDVKRAGKRVSLNYLLSSPWSNENSPPLSLVDPELMAYALRVFASDYWRAHPKPRPGEDARAFEGRVIYSVLPHNSGVQEEWLPIDETDPAVARIAQAARRELSSLKDADYRMRPALIGPYWGLIVSR